MAHDLEFPGLAKSTNDVYLKHLDQFVAHFGRSADQLGRKHVCSWLFWLRRTKQLSPATVNVAISALGHLFAALNRPEVMAGIRQVREYRAPSGVLSASEVQRLIAAATTIKYRAMFSLLSLCGPYASPSCSLCEPETSTRKESVSASAEPASVHASSRCRRTCWPCCAST